MSAIVAVNVSDRVALTDDGMVIEFDTMFDRDGEETDDTNAATVAIVELPNGNWAVLAFRDFDPTMVH